MTVLHTGYQNNVLVLECNGTCIIETFLHDMLKLKFKYTLISFNLLLSKYRFT